MAWKPHPIPRLAGVAAVVAAAAVSGPVADPASAEDGGISDGVRAACMKRIPEELRTAEGLEGSGAEGTWRITPGEMNAAAPLEAVLVVARTNRPVEIFFLGEKASGDIVDKKVKLERPAASASVFFGSFADGRTLAHVDGAEGGQVLLAWNGEKLDTVWKIGPGTGGARYWFETEDLDGDGTAEVVTYMQRQLDVFLDEDDLEDSSAGVGNAAVDVVDVYRWDDGRWKKSKELRRGLR